MDLTKILEYQKLDIQRKKIEKEFEKSHSRVELEKVRKSFNAAKQNAKECENFADKVMKFYEDVTAGIKDKNEKIDELSAKLDVCDDEEQRNKIIQDLKLIQTKLSDLQKQFQEIIKTSGDVVDKHASFQKKGAELKEKFTSLKPGYDKIKDESEQKIRKINGEIEKLKGEIDPELLNKYNALKNDNIYPVFVPAQGEKMDICCGGCGMGMSQKALADFQNKGISVCENCKRYIYKL